MKFNNLYKCFFERSEMKTDCRCVGKNVFNKKIGCNVLLVRMNSCLRDPRSKQKAACTKPMVAECLIPGPGVLTEPVYNDVFRNVFIEITYMGNVFTFFPSILIKSKYLA